MHSKAIAFFLFGFLTLPLPLQAANETLYVGKAKVEITPAAGTPLAGYGKRHGKPSAAIHDPIFARAFALTLGEKTFLILSTDLVLIDAKIRKQIVKRIPLPEENILLSATHNHSGPGAYGSKFWERFIMGKKRKAIFEKIVSGISEAGQKALKEKIPAQAGWGEIEISELIQNRMDSRKKGPYFLKVLRFKEADSGQLLGNLIFMAAHPTLFPAMSFQMSSDFPGVFTSTLDQKFPGSTSLLINGAAGDLRPHFTDPGNAFQKPETFAFLLSQKMEQISFHPLSLQGPWEAIFRKEKLPWTRIRLGFLKIPGGYFFPTQAPFQTLRFGKIIIFAFPGELGSDIGHSLENQARAFLLEPFIAGFSNDYIAYVIPRPYYQDRHQYESRASFYGPKMDWFVEEKFRKLMLQTLSPEEQALVEKPGELSYQKDLPVLSLSGDAYHVGFEEGRLLQTEIRTGIEDIFRYFRSELRIPLLNRWIINFIANRAWKKQEPYISYEEYLQMKGIAEGSGVSFKKIKQIHGMPEVYPTLCANGAFFGKATADGSLIALRNLDWNRKMGIHRHAAVKWIQIPGRLAYANIGYNGFAGVLSGINEKGISVGQIGASSSDETMKGTPMPFVLKRVLENSQSAEDGVQIIQGAFRTRGYHYLIADAAAKKAAVVESTAHHLAIFWPDDSKEKNVFYACPIENAVFRGDPALDPEIRNLQTASGGNPKKSGLESPKGSAYEIRYLKQGKLIQENYGKITPEIAETIAQQIAPGSNIQSVIYHYPEFFVANAKDDKKAADSGYTRFDLEEFKRMVA